MSTSDTTARILLSALLSLLLQPSGFAQWVPTNGPSNKAIVSLAINGSSLFAGTAEGTMYVLKGASWSKADSGLRCTYVGCLATGGGSIFAGTDSGVFRSDDNGTSWQEVNTGLSKTLIHAISVRDTAGPYSPIAVVGTDSGIFTSSNRGTAWKSANGNLPDKRVTAVAVGRNNLVAGTALHGTFVSTDGGATWGPDSLLHVPTVSIYVNSLAAVGNSILANASWSYMFVSFYGGEFRSTDDGLSWTPGYTVGSIEGGQFRVLSLAAVNEYIFAAAVISTFMNPPWQGVYRSTDYGTNWIEVNTGLADSSVQSVAIMGNYIFAGTDSTGVWRRPLSDVISSVAQSASGGSQVFSLLQNYPNPFNPITTIRYGLPARSRVTLTVYNTLGQSVAVLVNEIQDAGYHEVRFSAGGHASGLYFYQLQAGNFRATKKLLLLQ